jgi:hypothetical protein
MKNFLMLLIAVSAAAALYSCASDEAKVKPDYLPPLKAEIPEELQSNQDAVEYIHKTTDVLNDFSRNLEDLFVEIKPYADKDESELSAMDKLKLTKQTLKFTGQVAMLGARMATMKETYDLMTDNLGEDEQKALDVINETFLNRIKALNEKYKELDYIKIEQTDSLTKSDTIE